MNLVITAATGDCAFARAPPVLRLRPWARRKQ